MSHQKDKVDMINEIIFLVEESEEGGYTARAMGYSIYTEADTLEEIKQAATDAVRCHFGYSQGDLQIEAH